VTILLYNYIDVAANCFWLILHTARSIYHLSQHTTAALELSRNLRSLFSSDEYLLKASQVRSQPLIQAEKSVFAGLTSTRDLPAETYKIQ